MCELLNYNFPFLSLVFVCSYPFNRGNNHPLSKMRKCTQKEKMTGVYHPHFNFFVQSGQREVSEREKQVMISVCLAMFGIALFGIQCVILFLYQPAYPNYYIPLAYLPSLLSIILSIVLFATTKVPLSLTNTIN